MAKQKQLNKVTRVKMKTTDGRIIFVNSSMVDQFKASGCVIVK